MATVEKRIKVPTTGLFDFPELIRSEKGKYVDKTALLYELCSDANQQLFISRPRRFGKSLMLSTLKAMFEGRRELFKGLALDLLPWEGWETPTPVYSFTMSKAVGETYELFIEQLMKLVMGLCAEAGVPYVGGGPVSGQFDDFLRAVAAKSPTETVKKVIGGVEVEWAKRDEMACSKAFREGGHNRELSPFDGNYPRKYGYGLAHEGSCGCIRACMVHLEQRAKMSHGFRNPFRKPGWKQWKIDHTKPYEIPQDIAAEYIHHIEDKEGRVESDEDPFSPLND